MTKLEHKLAGGAVALLTLAATAFADVKLNDNLTVSGWATSSYQNTTYSPSDPFGSTDSFNLDGAQLTGVITPVAKGPVTGTVSLFYRPNAEGGVSPDGSEITLLDAFVAYDAGGGVTITAGKFLSYLGYESFYAINDNMISLANQALLAPIPGYHEGVKLDYAPDKTSTMGVALVDSLFQKPGYNATAGSGHFKGNGGAEAYYQYTGINNLTVWAGIGYSRKVMPGTDTSGVQDPLGSTVTVYDIWATYQLTKNSSLALEEIYKDGGLNNKGSNWLAYYQYNFSDKASAWFCVSGEEESQLTYSDGEGGFTNVSGPKYIKYSFSPTYALTANVSLRAQYSYTEYSNITGFNSSEMPVSLGNSSFFGVEALFKF